MSMNGRPPIPFPGGPGVPLVGQPFTLKGFFPTVVIQCNCEGKGVVTLVANGPSVCPACGRGFVIGSVTYRHDRPQDTQIGVALLRVEEPAAPAGVVS